jgi:hypothetical protein
MLPVALRTAYSDGSFLVACNRPYPVLVGSLMLANKTARPRHFGVEFTPLYFGAPALHDGMRPISLGGGLAEPLAIHTLAPRKKAVDSTGNDVSKQSP